MSTFRRFTLYKRTSGVYHVSYHVNGRRRWKSTGCTTKPEALSALADFRELVQSRLKSVPFETFAQEFHSSNNFAAGTLQRYGYIFARFKTFIRGRHVDEIDAQAVESYKAKRMAEISAVSVNIELRMLKAAFSVAKRWKYTEANPFDEVPFCKIPERAPLALTPAEFEKLFSLIREGWFRDLVAFGVLTGMRRGELLNLKWSDVNFERKVLNIETNATWRTKTGKRRTLPLSEAALNILNARRGRGMCENVFHENDAMLKPSRVTRRFKWYVRKAKLENPRLRFHSLRHSFASWLVQRGVSLYSVQTLMGHSSSTVTETYAHLLPEGMHAEVEKIRLLPN